ncbi:hypothetical protein SAMN05421789_11617 [Kaistella chaponensis]|jgi:hypothetical protein|uniref:Uncharacterized protein n=1 Tax=Kaistella chaponensis TaxID=713588 RepID=A0A1N7NPA6_9FLAO|nr:hypothetical protein [Kaistella chaponensis]SIT00152.1 hypothetical protein SAMN05421789_11617 [Kaistella chaponensis]
MENSMIEIKNDLIDWIENTFDLEILQKVLDLKKDIASSSLISDINSETIEKDDFDQQFAAGMNSDELLENIVAHIESIASEEPSSVVSDVQPKYPVKDDFDERFSQGISGDELLEDVFAHIDSLPCKEK